MQDVLTKTRTRFNTAVATVDHWLDWLKRRSLIRRFMNLRGWRLAVAIALLVGVVAPLLTFGSVALGQYAELRGWADDGVQQLTAIQELIPTGALSSSSASPTATVTTNATPNATGTPGAGSGGIQQKAKDILNKDTLTKIKDHCDKAAADFAHINDAITHGDGILGIALGTVYRPKLIAIQHMAAVGARASALGSELAGVGLDFSNSFETSPFSPVGGPILTQHSFDDLQKAANDSLTTLKLVQGDLAATDFDQLPVSAHQRDQLKKAAQLLPKYLGDLESIQPFMPLIGWALGVDKQRTYLIQTMDRYELRPGGGFTGAYGILNINGGRVGAISLTDVDLLYPLDGPQPPKQYYWWPFGNFGLRDSNLSGDFPTTAGLAEYYYKDVTNTQVDGVIDFSPTVIEHMLDPQVLGPLYLPCYNDTITKDNLEDKLHYYQLGAGQAIQKQCSSDTSTSARKRFTSALATELQNKVRAASQDTLLKILKTAQADLQTKELQIYVNNADLEKQLTLHNIDGAITRNPSTDATYVVQANISVNKGTKYAATTMNEAVTLRSNGDAYHDLKITIDYQPTGSVFGESVYRDYIRVYAPPNARYVFGSGFDQNSQQRTKPNQAPKPPPPPLCYIADPAPDGTLPPPVVNPDGTTTPYAPTASPCQPDQAPVCKVNSSNPNGLFLPYANHNSWENRLGGSLKDHMDDIGEPTDLVSDEPGRSMFAGLVIVPPFCKATVDIRWIVPGAAGTSDKQSLPYTLLIERQSGSFDQENVTIRPASGTTTKTEQCSGQLIQNFTLEFGAASKATDPLKCSLG